MREVDIHEAKTHLSRLLKEVEAGAEITVTKDGHPIAKLVPIAQPPGKRKLGFLEGKLKVGADFDDPLPEDVLASFEGDG